MFDFRCARVRRPSDRQKKWTSTHAGHRTPGIANNKSRAALPAAGASAVGLWAAVTTQNDEWDAYFTPAPTTPRS